MHRLVLLLLAAVSLSAASCASKRIVLSGPKEIGVEEDDYDPMEKEKNEQKMQRASAMGMEGQIDKSGGRGFMQRFAKLDFTGDPRKTDAEGKPNDYNHSQMEGKMFGKELKESSMKSYAQTKDFVTKNFGGEKSYRTKEFGGSETEAREMKTDIRQTGTAIEEGSLFVDRTSPIPTGAASGTDKTYATTANRQDGKTYTTGNFLPAEREMGRDRYNVDNAPAHMQGAVSALVRSRTKKNPATVEEINEMVGKQR